MKKITPMITLKIVPGILMTMCGFFMLYIPLSHPNLTNTQLLINFWSQYLLICLVATLCVAITLKYGEPKHIFKAEIFNDLCCVDLEDWLNAMVDWQNRIIKDKYTDKFSLLDHKTWYENYKYPEHTLIYCPFCGQKTPFVKNND